MVRLRVTESTQSIPVEEGQYVGEVVNVSEVAGKFGECLRIVFSLNGSDAQTGSALFGKRLSPGSKLDLVIRSLGVEPLSSGEEFDTDDLLGKKALVYVESGTDSSGRTYNNVTKIKPFKNEAVTPAVPAVAAPVAAPVAPAVAAPAVAAPVAAPVAPVAPAAPAAKAPSVVDAIEF